MKVRDIMTIEVATASPQATLDDIAKIMRDEDVGAIPVVEDGELTGIVTDRDIVIRCNAEGKAPAEITVEEVITGGLETVDPETDVEDASRLMSERQIRRLPVVDNGELVGMVSLGDIAVKHADERVSGEALEEVSKGVKGSGRKQQQGRSGKAAQGISNAARKREDERQARVVPFRAQADASTRGARIQQPKSKAPRRRKAS